MQVISVINYKGGVGKTTLTANLGAELAYRGGKVLLLDLDPQASLTFSFVTPDYWQNSLSKNRTIKKWYESFNQQATLDLASIITEPQKVKPHLGKAGGELHLIPSDLGLINVDLELATELTAATLKQSKMKYLRLHRRLADELVKPGFQYYDYILIDCPPNFNIVTKTAIVASDHILIPAKADYLSTLGITYLQRSLDQLVSDYNEYSQLSPDDDDGTIDPHIVGVVFTMIQIYGGQPISALRPYIDQTKRLGVPVFDNHMRENKTLFSDAPQYGIPLVLGISPPSSSNIISELEALVSEFVERLEE